MLFLGLLSLLTLIDKIMAQVIKIVRNGGWGPVTLTVHAGLSHPLPSYPLWLRAIPKPLT